MIEEIKNYILDNWHSLGIAEDKPRVLSTLQISKSHTRPYEKGKIIQLVFKNNEPFPFCVIKFCRAENFQSHLEREIKILEFLEEKGFKYSPRRLHSTVINKHFLSIESFCRGYSQDSLLHNFVYSPHYTQEGLIELLQSFADVAAQIHNDLNTFSQIIDNLELKKEINCLVSEYADIFSPQDIEKKLVELLINEILENWNMPCRKRLVHCDLVTNNIICYGRNFYLVDWEFVMLSSSLTLLEPIRFIFCLFRSLQNLKLLPLHESFFDCLDASFDPGSWFYPILINFLSKTINYKTEDKKDEAAYYRKLFILFFLYDSILQFNMSKYPSPETMQVQKDYINYLTGYYRVTQLIQKEIESFYKKVKKHPLYKVYTLFRNVLS